MRIADVLLHADDDFAGESIAVAAQLQRRGRRKRVTHKIFGCSSPRSILPRWLSMARMSKERRTSVVKIEKLERETRRDGCKLDIEASRERKELGCSMNGVNGESSSLVSQGSKRDSEIAEVSGLYRKKNCLNLAVGFGLFYLMLASKNELDKMIELRTEMEMFVRNLKEEFEKQSMQILSKQSESNCIPSCSTTDTQESLGSNKNVLSENQEDSDDTVFCDHSLTYEADRQGKCLEGIDQLEAELEAELERLQLRLDTEDILEHPKQKRMEGQITVEDTAPVRSLDASLGELVDDAPEEDIREHFGVAPSELERKLHELVESRLQERIEELEAALECANEKLREKEREVWTLHTHFSPCPNDLPLDKVKDQTA